MSNLYDKPVDEMTDDDKYLREALISQAAGLIHSITDFYGPEKGMEVWEDVARGMQDLKGDVFIAMLNGTAYGHKTIILRGFVGGTIHSGQPTPANSLYNILMQAGSRNFTTGPAYDKVSAIKAVRSVANYGLKEAKDCVDALSVTSVRIEITNAENRITALRLLRQAGLDAV